MGLKLWHNIEWISGPGTNIIYYLFNKSTYTIKRAHVKEILNFMRTLRFGGSE